MRRPALILLTLLLTAASVDAQEPLKPRLEVPFTSEVEDLAFSPDGQQLVVVGRKQSWMGSPTEGKFRPLVGAPKELTAVLFTPDGKELVAASSDSKIYVWSWATGKLRLQFLMPRFRPEGTRSASRIVLSPDGKSLAVGEHNGGEIFLWDLTSGKPLPQGPVKHIHPNKTCASITGLCFSSDGRLLASSSVERTARIWEVATGREVTRFPPASEVPSHAMNGVAFFPDGGLVATQGSGNGLRLWGVTSGKVHWRFDYPTAGVQLSFSPGGRFLGAFRIDPHTLQCWDLLTGHSSRTTPWGFGGVRFAPNGQWLTTLLPGKLLTWPTVALANANLPTARVKRLPSKDALLWTLNADGTSERTEEVRLATGPDDLPVLTARVSRLLTSHRAIRGRLEQLVGELSSNQFARREKADQELRRLARAGDYVLRELLNQKLPPETTRRLQLALEQAKVPSVEALLWLSTVELLEFNGSTRAQQLLAQLACGEPPTLAAEARAALQRLQKKTAGP